MAFFAANGDAARRVDAIAAGMSCQTHRGPDELGTWHDDHAAFGFNRLSIIDIEGSAQPLRWGPPEHPDRYVMVFNGEIYNYLPLRAELAEQYGAVFATHGDGEAILAGYHHLGPDVVTRLRGMFAFAIWDTVEATAFIARDHFGIKPLYVAELTDGIAFASEAKSLRTLTEQPAAIDPDALQHFLVLQYVPEPATMDTHIRKLESGCRVTIKIGDGSPATPVFDRYFHPTFAPTPVAGDAGRSDLYRGIAKAMTESVTAHMQADVPVGSFLSGGIDSTAIAAIARRVNPDLLTFTTGFAREGFSEIDIAAESARALGVEHIVYTVSEEELTATLPLILWYLDDPVADPALVPLYFVAREARKHVKVALSGEGADELFGGYNIYREPASLKWMTSLPSPLRRGLAAVGRALPGGMRGKDMLRRGAMDLEERYYGNARIFREEELAELLRTYSPKVSLTDVTGPVYAQSAGWDPIARMQHIDLFTWLRGDILVKADKMTMANSLEVRTPFLDKEIFELARTIGPREKIGRGTSKLALRAALADIVPPHVLHRRKLGFPVPIRHYLAGDSYEWARSIITSAETDEFLDASVALRLLDDHRKGVADHSRRIWTVLVFMLWYSIFVTGTVRPEVPQPHGDVRP